MYGLSSIYQSDSLTDAATTVVSLMEGTLIERCESNN